jgi:hypothetical protein
VKCNERGPSSHGGEQSKRWELEQEVKTSKSSNVVEV